MRNRNGSGGSVERQESESEGRDLLRRALVRSRLRSLLVRRFCSEGFGFRGTIGCIVKYLADEKLRCFHRLVPGYVLVRARVLNWASFL